MEVLYVWGALGAIWATVVAIGWVFTRLGEWRDSSRELRRKAKLYDERVGELSRLDADRRELDSRQERIARYGRETEEKLARHEREAQETLARRERETEEKLAHQQRNLERYERETQEKLARQAADLERIAKEKSEGFPWLAQAFADYFELEGLKEADLLRRKKHPARVAADRVREISRQRRQVEAELRIAKYLLHYYENLFPWLVDFRGEDLDDLIESRLKRGEQPEEAQLDDPARGLLTDAEYRNLPTAQKYQRALDRHWTKKKSRWEVGRDYERYVGYLYWTRGFDVYYQGIVEGLADIGRDLVATKGHQVDIVQCKYWSKEKTIHEKHIFQLFGTVTAYRVDHPTAEVEAIFITSTGLSDRAKLFADRLGIRYMENRPLDPYPSIKCNVSRRDGAKIYHLPFDQQYDRTLVEEERLECYVATVEEAERLGFRRAFRWRGPAREPSS